MKKLFFILAIVATTGATAQSGFFKKAKKAVAGEQNTASEPNKTKSLETTGPANKFEGVSLNELLQYSSNHFASIKGPKISHDDYGMSGDGYTVIKCLEGSSKCVLTVTDYDCHLKIRIGAEKVSWEEAEKLVKEWYPKIMAITEWGKTSQGFTSEVEKGYKADFTADRNYPAGDKYKNMNIELRTYYFTDTEFQVVITIDN